MLCYKKHKLSLASKGKQAFYSPHAFQGRHLSSVSRAIISLEGKEKEGTEGDLGGKGGSEEKRKCPRWKGICDANVRAYAVQQIVAKHPLLKSHLSAMRSTPMPV